MKFFIQFLTLALVLSERRRCLWGHTRCGRMQQAGWLSILRAEQCLLSRLLSGKSSTKIFILLLVVPLHFCWWVYYTQLLGKWRSSLGASSVWHWVQAKLQLSGRGRDNTILTCCNALRPTYLCKCPMKHYQDASRKQTDGMKEMDGTRNDLLQLLAAS